MSQYRVGGFQILPPVVKNLLIINGLMFLASNVLIESFGINLWYLLGLHWIGSQGFEVYQVITYMFMHGDLSHIFFNMFAVWMFGSAIENHWGAKRFLTYYVITGIGAAILHYTILYFTDIGPTMALINGFLNDPSAASLQQLVGEHTIGNYVGRSQEMLDLYNQSLPALNAVLNDVATPAALDQSVTFLTDYRQFYLNLPLVVGASGSLFGLLLAFGMMFPNVRIFLIFFPIPIKAKYFVMGYGAIELISGLVNRPGDNVAHFAHLGGMLFGYLLIRWWQNNRGSKSYYQ